MTRDHLATRLREIITEHLAATYNRAVPEITEGSSFVDDLGCDSLDCVEIVMAVEEAFDVEFSDDEAEGIKVFSQAVGLLASKLSVAA